MDHRCISINSMTTTINHGYISISIITMTINHGYISISSITITIFVNATNTKCRSNSKYKSTATTQHS